ncbi:MAG: hypothetical protein Q9226_005817 [Calogaya cf. arnoldii]
MSALPKPPGYLQQDKGPNLVRIIWIFESFSLIVACLKVWTRVKVLRQSGLEDVFILLSAVLSLVYGSLLTASIHYGLGRHAAAIAPTVLKALKFYAAAIPFGMLSVTLPTLAIAIIIKQTTDPLPRQLRILYGVPCLNLLIRIVNVILVFLSCPQDSAIDYTIWVVIEGDVIIITACVPGLRPFVKYLRQRYGSEHGQIQNIRLIAQKSNRISEITVPASSASQAQTHARCSRSVSNGEQPQPEENIQEEDTVELMSSKTHDVERQSAERWRESEDTRRHTVEAKTGRESFPSIHRDGEAGT